MWRLLVAVRNPSFPEPRPQMCVRFELLGPRKLLGNGFAEAVRGTGPRDVARTQPNSCCRGAVGSRGTFGKIPVERSSAE